MVVLVVVAARPEIVGVIAGVGSEVAGEMVVGRCRWCWPLRLCGAGLAPVPVLAGPDTADKGSADKGSGETYRRGGGRVQ